MSRLIVKNLPKNVKEEKLRGIFSKTGEITDCSLRYTKDGVFRKFAFIGYRTSEEAETAVKYFNKSFVDSSKIQVEIAKDLNDPNKPRPWSKHSQGSSAYQKDHYQVKDVEIQKKDKQQKKKKDLEEKSSRAMETLLGDLKDDPEFKQFSEVHKSRASKPLWVDDAGPSNDNQVIGDSAMSSDEDDDNTETNEKLIPVEQGCPVTEVQNKMRNEKFAIQVKGLAAGQGEKQIRQFFEPIKVKCIRVPSSAKRTPTGLPTVEFECKKDLEQALRRNKLKIGGKRIFLKEVKSQVSAGTDFHQTENTDVYSPVDEVSDDIIIETGRLFLRNLSYACSEEDLQNLFSGYGPLTEVTVPIDKQTKKIKGYAIITFMMPEHAVKAYSELDGSIFQGRMLHIIPGKPPKEDEVSMEEGSSYKNKKAAQTKKTAASSHNWNTLFMGTSAVADIMAQKFDTSKQQILDSESSQSLGVRMALGETQIVTETRNFLISHGVCLDVFSQPAAARSKTVILVKNLPSCTQSEEILTVFKKYGSIKQVIMPPSGITAIVEFEHGNEAKNAFTNLAYTKFQHTPLFLEWAPMGVFVAEEEKKTKGTSDDEEDESETESQPGCTLFIKNLNFDTTEDSLTQVFSQCGKLKNVTIAKKKDLKNPGNQLSMGYGFVEYSDKTSLQNALKTLQHVDVDGHSLELKLSERSTTKNVKTTRKQAAKKKQKSSKILVRNIPFEANVNEIKELFKVFGELKTVRLPKKMQGASSHRGFGFVDFVTKQDAKRAFDSLVHSTHLFGRRLVLEWADVEEESVESLRRKTADHYAQSDKPNKRVKKSSLLNSLQGGEQND